MADHRERDSVPFYLVTHTSLIEAESEEAAAVSALDKIKAAEKLTFGVTIDSKEIHHVVVDGGFQSASVDDVARAMETDLSGAAGLADNEQFPRPVQAPNNTPDSVGPLRAILPLLLGAGGILAVYLS